MTEGKPWAAAAAALSPPFVPLTAALLPGSLGRLGAGCHALQGDMLSIMYPRPALPACRGAWARTWAWRAQPWPLACRVLTSRSSWCWFSRCARRCGASAASAGRQLGCRARLLSAERLHRRRKTLRCAQSGLTPLQARQSGVDSQDGTAWRRRGAGSSSRNLRLCQPSNSRSHAPASHTHPRAFTWGQTAMTSSKSKYSEGQGGLSISQRATGGRLSLPARRQQ